jgi:hypothetical protein
MPVVLLEIVDGLIAKFDVHMRNLAAPARAGDRWVDELRAKILAHVRSRRGKIEMG